MKQTKRTFHPYQFYDHTGIVRWLEDRALQGWKLESVGSFSVWRFRSIEPRKLHYSVVYFPDSSEFDPDITVGQRELIELCREGGWEYITKQAQMMIFCSEFPNPVPIETDTVLQVETVHKAMKKNFLPAQFVLLMLGMVQGLMWLNNVKMYRRSGILEEVLPSLTVTLLCCGVIILLSAVHLLTYYLWLRKAKKAALDGVFLPIRSMAWFDRLCLGLVLAVFGVWVLTLVGKDNLLLVVMGSLLIYALVFAAAFGAKALMKALNAEREVNRWVTIGMVALMTVVGTILLGILVLNI